MEALIQKVLLFFIISHIFYGCENECDNIEKAYYGDTKQVSLECCIKENRKGWCKNYYEKGSLMAEIYVGKKITAKTYYENGKLKFEVKIVDTMGLGKGYYESGKLQSEGMFKFKEQNGYPTVVREGIHIFYFENGVIQEKSNYLEGYEANGRSLWYYNTGRIKGEGYYNKGGQSDGLWKEYSEDGELIKTILFNNGEVVKEDSLVY